MALSNEDLAKVPPELTVPESYERIRAWHTAHGESELPKYRVSARNRDQYLAILPALPPTADGSLADIAFLFYEVLTGTFEWSYHIEDADGIKMAAYANHGAGQIDGGNMNAIGERAATSDLSRFKG